MKSVGFKLLCEALDAAGKLDATCGFDMKYGMDSRTDAKLHPCGSACCIGGHAGLILTKHPALMGDLTELEVLIPSFALAQLLGIGRNQADRLCYPPANSNGWFATTTDAITMLKRVENGEANVRWPYENE